MQSNERESDGSGPQESPMAPDARAWLPLLPISIVAVGGPEQPLEKLLTLQSAIAQAVRFVTVVAHLRPTLRLNRLPHLRFR